MTFEALKEVIVACVGCDEEKVVADARLIPDVCKDSLDTVELAMALEDKTGVNVPDDVMPTFRTLNDLLGYMNEQGA